MLLISPCFCGNFSDSSVSRVALRIDFLQTFDFLNSSKAVRYITLSLGQNNVSFLTFLPCFFLLLLLVNFLLILTIRLLILPLHLILLLALIFSSVPILDGVLTELFPILLMFCS